MELQGYGTQTRGGLDGRVIKVTNLNPDGPGSFKEAVKAKGPRLVVFEVGGYPTLESSYRALKVPDVDWESWLDLYTKQVE